MTTPGVAWITQEKKKNRTNMFAISRKLQEFSLVWKLKLNLDSMD